MSTFATHIFNTKDDNSFSSIVQLNACHNLDLCLLKQCLAVNWLADDPIYYIAPQKAMLLKTPGKLIN